MMQAASGRIKYLSSPAEQSIPAAPLPVRVRPCIHLVITTWGVRTDQTATLGEVNMVSPLGSTLFEGFEDKF